MARKKRGMDIQPGDLLLIAADEATQRPELDHDVAGIYRQLLHARYLGSGLFPSERAAGAGESRASDTEETLARIVATAVGIALDQTRSPQNAVFAAYEGVLTALRWATFADLLIEQRKERDAADSEDEA